MYKDGTNYTGKSRDYVLMYLDHNNDTMELGKGILDHFR